MVSDQHSSEFSLYHCCEDVQSLGIQAEFLMAWIDTFTLFPQWELGGLGKPRLVQLFKRVLKEPYPSGPAVAPSWGCELLLQFICYNLTLYVYILNDKKARRPSFQKDQPFYLGWDTSYQQTFLDISARNRPIVYPLVCYWQVGITLAALIS